MEATVVLTGIGNFVRFPDGVSENRLYIKLPNGQEIQAIISDDDLAAVVGSFGYKPEADQQPAFVPVYVRPPAPSPASDSFERELLGEQEAYIFKAPEASPAPTIEDLPAPTVAPPKKRKGKLVGKDAAGNPIVEYENGQSMEDVVGTVGHKDEDGVAQL